MKKKQWLNYVLLYLFWAVLIVLGFWFLIRSRDTALIVLGYYAGDDFNRLWRAGFFDKAFFLFLGLALVVYFYATEAYLRAGIEKQDLLRRFFKTAGWVLLVIFVVDVVLLVLQQSIETMWLRWVIPVAELGLGIVLSWMGRRKPRNRIEPPTTMNQVQSHQS